MAEVEVNCEVNCELCGWKTAGTIVTDEANVVGELARMISCSSRQHRCRGRQGKLHVAWEPAKPGGEE